MTQSQGYGPYQTPQVPPPVGYGYEAGGGIAPAAKRASVLMYVIGAVAVLGGLCCGGTGAMLPQLLERQPELVEQMPAEFSAQLMQWALVVGAVLGVIYGVALVVLGLFVGKGKRGAIITAIVLAGLATLYMVFNALSSLRMGVGGACLTTVPLVLHVLLLVWLVQGLKRPVATAGMQQGYPPGYLEYWQQYQRWQQQQQQQQGGGGAVPPMPPPPPSTGISPPPTWQPPPVSRGDSPGEGGSRGPTDPT